METPTRKGRRKLSRVLSRKPKSHSPPVATVSESITRTSEMAQEETASFCQKAKKTPVKESTLPSTQAFLPTCTPSSLVKEGEVYWDSNSPSLKAKILRQYSSSPDVKPPSPKKASTPLTRVTTQESPRIDEQDMSLLQSLRDLNNFDKDDSIEESKENTFNSNEDSFVVQASQVHQQSSNVPCQNPSSTIKIEATQTRDKPPELPHLPSPAFDNDEDDDEMDLLLSQIEMPNEVHSPTTVLNIHAVRSQVTAPKAEEPFLKRRFKSAENISGMKKSPASPANTNMKAGWRRSNTEPQTCSGSTLPGGRIPCTKEEIEKKRQQAIQRREMEAQKRSSSSLPGNRIVPPGKTQCSKEDIEKKRLEAIRRRKAKLQGQRN